MEPQNVYIIDDSFYIPQLQRWRRIWLYLPPDYFTSGKAYPVLYMHDGQNLFDASTAFGAEWEVDETLNRLRGRCIVVGIDNGGSRRIPEYTVHDTKHGIAEGRAYMRFVVETLKPYIDKTYRTLPGRDSTTTAGSSLGGLIAFYLCMHYPHVFGGGGIFSPAFWIDPLILEEMSIVAGNNHTLPQRYYFFAGAREDALIWEGMQAMLNLLRQHGHYALSERVDPKGGHDEKTWRRALPRFFRWLLPSAARRKRAAT